MDFVTDNLFSFNKHNGKWFLYIYPYKTLQEGIDKQEKFFDGSELIEGSSLWYSIGDNSYRISFKNNSVSYIVNFGSLREDVLIENNYIFDEKDLYEEDELVFVWWKPWKLFMEYRNTGIKRLEPYSRYFRKKNLGETHIQITLYSIDKVTYLK